MAGRFEGLSDLQRKFFEDLIYSSIPMNLAS